MTVLHIAITVRNRTTSEEPPETALRSSTSAYHGMELIRKENLQSKTNIIIQHSVIKEKHQWVHA